jgi:hypothetical protein
LWPLASLSITSPASHPAPLLLWTSFDDRC